MGDGGKGLKEQRSVWVGRGGGTFAVGISLGTEKKFVPVRYHECLVSCSDAIIPDTDTVVMSLSLTCWRKNFSRLEKTLQVMGPSFRKEVCHMSSKVPYHSFPSLADGTLSDLGP